MVSLIPVILLLVSLVILGQREPAFNDGVGLKIVVAAAVITALSAVGLR